MEKPEAQEIELYQAPVPPDGELQPDAKEQLAFLRAKYQEARSAGYQAYQQARARQAAADDALSRGKPDDYRALINGLVDGQGNAVVVGARQLDGMAQVHWTEAGRYKDELDALQREMSSRNPKVSFAVEK